MPQEIKPSPKRNWKVKRIFFLTWRYHGSKRIFIYKCFVFQELSNELLGHLKNFISWGKPVMLVCFTIKHKNLKLLKTNRELSNQNRQELYDKLFSFWDPIVLKEGPFKKKVSFHPGIINYLWIFSLTNPSKSLVLVYSRQLLQGEHFQKNKVLDGEPNSYIKWKTIECIAFLTYR